MTRIVFSKHAIEDRTDRIVKIATAMGFGEVIEEFPSENYMGPTRHCLTNTGVIIVKPRDKEEVITMFAVSDTKMRNYYEKAAKAIPLYMIKVARQNKKRFLDLVSGKE